MVAAAAVAVTADAAAAAIPVAVAPEGLLARVIAWDHALLRSLARRDMHPALNWPLVALVRIGDGYIWALAAALLWWSLPLPDLKRIVAHCLVAIAISLAIYWPVKLSTRRLRPHNSGLGVTAKVPPLDRYSFPSGHTMNNLAVALTLAAHVPGLFPAAVGVPLLLGCLRVLFGVHFLTDIVAGAFLGALSHALSNWAILLLGA